MARASTYLERGRGRSEPEQEALQELRREAEEARQAALNSQAEAERSREALNQRLADLQLRDENDARLAEARERLQPGDRVVVPRFGYDRPGRIVRLDPRKKMAVVAIGQMNWDVSLAELIPQVIRTQAAGAPALGKARTGPVAGALRLEDFDEPASEGG